LFGVAGLDETVALSMNADGGPEGPGVHSTDVSMVGEASEEVEGSHLVRSASAISPRHAEGVHMLSVDLGAELTLSDLILNVIPLVW